METVRTNLASRTALAFSALALAVAVIASYCGKRNLDSTKADLSQTKATLAVLETNTLRTTDAQQQFARLSRKIESAGTTRRFSELRESELVGLWTAKLATNAEPELGPSGGIVQIDIASGGTFTVSAKQSEELATEEPTDSASSGADHDESVANTFGGATGAGAPGSSSTESTHGLRRIASGTWHIASQRPRIELKFSDDGLAQGISDQLNALDVLSDPPRLVSRANLIFVQGS